MLTTLFAGCFAVSSLMAEDTASRTGFFVDAKVTTGVAFASKVRAKEISYKDSAGNEVKTGVTYGTSGKHDGASKTNNSADKNTKKKSSVFIGVALGGKYNFNELFSLGGEIFYDAMNIKLKLKDDVDGLNDTSKIRGRYGLMVLFGWTPLQNMTFDLGVGIAKTTKIKDLHMYTSADFADAEQAAVVNGMKFRNNIGLIVKLGANYVLSNNLSLGLDLKMQQVKAKNKKVTLNNKYFGAGKIAKFKCNLYTIGATLTYTF